MSKNLVIVESPAKAKTIAKFLGKDFIVKSSFGHIRDLPKKGMSVDIANNFAPSYEVSSDKKKVVSELKKAAKEAEIIWLASDEDREGEAIAWHLAEVLKLDPKKTKRIVFHEITEPAIKAAVETPRTIDVALVYFWQETFLPGLVLGPNFQEAGECNNLALCLQDILGLLEADCNGGLLYFGGCHL